MRRYLLLRVVLSAGAFSLGCAPDDTPTGAPSGAADPFSSANVNDVATSTPGQPIAGLTPPQLDQFGQGLQVFATAFSPETGLGPLFNSGSCAQCHDDPALGGYGDSAEVHATAFHRGSACQVLDAVGGPVVQQHATPLLQAALGIQGEPTPPGATATGMRTTPLIFGLGLLDAVSDRTIKGLARIRYSDGVHGRPAILPDGRIGRFGRKATTATLDEFNAGAFFNEMGITNALNPAEGSVAGQALPAGVDPASDPELSSSALSAADAFVRFLAPVAPQPATDEIRFGQRLFSDVRCTSCHTPWLPTGNSPVAALRFKRVYAYTDLLLHDMGNQLADICNGVASPREFRTQPLMGMQFLDMFMHDGASGTIEEAIQRHGGEGAAARDRFLRLNSRAQAALVAFVKSR
jgi:CxxC motif-containing protein (DUF1111 family)